MPHNHHYDAIAVLATYDGPACDYLLLGRYLGALRDNCTECRIRERNTVADDPVTTGWFVVMTAAGVRMTARDPHALDKLAEGPYTRIVQASPALAHEPIFAASRAMTTAERRAALDWATGVFLALILHQERTP